MSHFTKEQIEEIRNALVMTAKRDTEFEKVEGLTETDLIPIIQTGKNKALRTLGKGLSSNDYTTEEKEKLAEIDPGAQANVQSDWEQTDDTQDDFIKNKPENLVQDADYVHTDNNYTTEEKTKLSGVEAGAEVNVQADWSESDSSDDSYIKNKPDLSVYALESDLETVAGKVEDIEDLIPAQASESNQLADKAFVNSSVSTATATFRGTYNLVTELGLTTSATEEQIATSLASEISTADNNDYTFVQIPTSDATPTEIARIDRYKYNGSAWSYEYSLNNSSFTAAQWAAINSGITTSKVTKLNDLPTNSELQTALGNKAEKSELTITPGTGSNVDKTTIQLKSGTSATVLVSHQDISGKEDKANKVTSFSNPTDTQYPSAKLTKDSLDAKADKDTDAVEGNLAKFDANGNPVDSGIASDEIGEIEEAISMLRTRAGIAEGIADTISAGTAQEFLQRQSGGDGVNCLKRIKGCTKAINQLVNPSTAEASKTENGITFTKNADGSISVSGTATAQVTYLVWASALISGHTYFMKGCPAGGGNNTYTLYLSDSGIAVSENGGGVLATAPQSGPTRIRIVVPQGSVITTPVTFRPKLTDLTLAGFADYTLEQILALYPNGFGAFNAGVLKSNDAAALETVGFNLLNEQWRRGDWNGASVVLRVSVIDALRPRVKAGTTYYLQIVGTSAYRIACAIVDGNNNLIDATSFAAAGGYLEVTPTQDCYLAPVIAKANINDSITAEEVANNCRVVINRSGSRNGEYQPYWQRVLAIRLSELTGIPEGGTEADRVTMFPNGLGGAGSAFDSLFVENGVTKARKTMTEEIDLGNYNYTYEAENTRMSTQLPQVKPGPAGAARVAPLICSKYMSIYDGRAISSVPDKSCYLGSVNYIYIKDSAYSDAAAFKTAMAGVKLIAEAATPIVYTDLQYADGTPFTMPATILVDNYGTERIQAPEGATTPSAPFCCDSNYSISIANLVKKLSNV